MAEEKYVVFRLGQESYCMNISFVKAIEEQYQIIYLPNAPEHVKGIIHLRGEIIPIYSLRSRFMMGEREAMDVSKLLVTNAGQIQLAFEVDDVDGIETVEEQQRKDIPVVIRSEQTNYIGGIIDVRGRIVVDISVKNIMSESEWNDIEEFVRENA